MSFSPASILNIPQSQGSIREEYLKKLQYNFSLHSLAKELSVQTSQHRKNFENQDRFVNILTPAHTLHTPYQIMGNRQNTNSRSLQHKDSQNLMYKNQSLHIL